MRAQDFDDFYFITRERDMHQRLEIHKLDRFWVFHQISELSKKDPIKLLDIGCSDGSFSEEFTKKGFQVFGMEPNKSQQEFATKKGLRIIESIKDLSELDIAVIRGSLHHLPEWEKSIDEILSIFSNSSPQSNQWIFILAEPNSESRIYRRFEKLPTIEESLRFKSNYKIFGAEELSDFFKSKGFEVSIQYPYFFTPYRSILIDSLKVGRMFSTNTYHKTPWFANVFNLAVRIIANPV